MTYTILLFVTRKPTITPEEFKDYWENKHMPLLQSLTGPLFPLHHTRRYIARIARKGFGTAANRNHPPLVLRGSPEDFDYDGIAEMTFEDGKAFQGFYRAIYETETAAKLAADEEKFVLAGSPKLIVVGDTTTSMRPTTRMDSGTGE